MICSVALLLLSVAASGQTDRREVRAGNRKFSKGAFQASEIDYRKAVLKDSTSMAGSYNLSNALYRQESFEEAAKAMEPAARAAADVQAVPDEAAKPVRKAVDAAADVFYNAGDIALQQKDYAAAVEAFKQSLLRRPGDIDAKENYIYAKLMLQNQQNGGGGGGQNDQNQDQNNQDQKQDQGDQGQSQEQPREMKISPQQAQQMLQAIQAKEKETQDKVNKEKAAELKSRQKEKNW